MKNNLCLLILMILPFGKAYSQEAAAPVIAVTQRYQVLSESTIQQKDGSSVTFRLVVPPASSAQVQPAAVAPPKLTAAQAAAMSLVPVKETQMLSISACVQANGFTVLRWICGASQRLEAVSNVDFRTLEGVGSFSTHKANYIVILSAGRDDQPMTAAELQAAQSLPVNGAASFALVAGSAASASPADEAAVNAMNALLNYFDTHKAQLLQQRAQREAARAASELARQNAPPPPPRQSIIHFWPLQPAQRAAILQNTRNQKGAGQP